MKKCFITLAFLTASLLGAWAQGSLQFNQAINKTAFNVASATFTVPAGKVWKVSTFSAHTGRPAMCDQTQVTYYLKANDAFICGNISGYVSASCSTSCGATSTKGGTTNGPLWFPENTVIELGFMGGLHNSSCSSLGLNGIEFNVVP
jgi:hypothetical protein